MRETGIEWSAEADSQPKNAGRQHRRDPALPTGKDVAGQRMRLAGLDVLRHGFRSRQPVRMRGGADVILSLRAQKGAEPHRQLLAGAVVLGFGLGADLIGLALKLQGGQHLGGVEKAVLHEGNISGRRDGR